ncbi:hypothetical protein LTEGF4_17210 [Limnohabitans sp. TEGF004]|nr:hypothetical protein LTEGF4_17210 [Limnohabitans sp. TEGF004]
MPKQVCRQAELVHRRAQHDMAMWLHLSDLASSRTIYAACPAPVNAALSAEFTDFNDPGVDCMHSHRSHAVQSNGSVQ